MQYFMVLYPYEAKPLQKKEALMELTINLTKKEINFLRTFAKNHHEGAKDNLGTMDAIHVIERKHTAFYRDIRGNSYRGANGSAYHSIEELIEERNLPSRASVQWQEVDNITIFDEDSYLQVYAPDIERGILATTFTPVAFFLILEEARRYINDYQKHNCSECRIYTYSAGYSNCGDFPVFRNLLLRMGSTLEQQKGVEEKERSNNAIHEIRQKRREV